MKAPFLQNEIESALIELVDGKTVKRSKFQLNDDETDLTESFESVLIKKQYIPKLLSDVNPEFGCRYPAFYFSNSDKAVYFGWVLWEKFHYQNHRKVWISELRELNGDWTICLEEQHKKTIWVNETESLAMEMDRLISW